MLFDRDELRGRTKRAQAEMAKHNLAALLLTQEADVRYFSGFLTRFWESPTRPWFVLVPAHGDPIAVIPSIGEALMRSGWIDDIRTWPAPQPGDDGVSLLVQTLKEIASSDGQIGIPSALESQMRMPRDTYESLCDEFGVRLTSDRGIVAQLRAIKSPAEVALIGQACAVANRAFARVPEIAKAGVPLSEVFRRFQMLCLEEGADWVGYLAGGAGKGGYSDVISPANDAPLQRGDILMLDTGVVVGGYYCDFDRNFSIGSPSRPVQAHHGHLIEATLAGLEAARPGATSAQLHAAMKTALGANCLDGRLGHGLGMQLTEGLSLIPEDDTCLAPGMVLTLEPGLDVGAGQIMVHEENILVTEDTPVRLSHFSDPKIAVI